MPVIAESCIPTAEDYFESLLEKKASGWFERLKASRRSEQADAYRRFERVAAPQRAERVEKKA
jgi:hypothetical protein